MKLTKLAHMGMSGYVAAAVIATPYPTHPDKIVTRTAMTMNKQMI